MVHISSPPDIGPDLRTTIKKLARAISGFCDFHIAPVGIKTIRFVALPCIEQRGKRLLVRIADKLENVIGKFGEGAHGSLLCEMYRLADCAQEAK